MLNGTNCNVLYLHVGYGESVCGKSLQKVPFLDFASKIFDNRKYKLCCVERSSLPVQPPSYVFNLLS